MELDDWKDLDLNVEVKKDIKPFKLTMLKLNHYYWYSGDIDNGMPINTSIELTSKYNFETNKEEWKKIVSHTYISLDNIKEYTTDTYEENINIEIINELEKYDLRQLKNNYFTDKEPEKYSRWEITYNNYFKIVGTYDNELEEVINIEKVLDFKRIMKEELDKIQNKIK